MASKYTHKILTVDKTKASQVLTDSVEKGWEILQVDFILGPRISNKYPPLLLVGIWIVKEEPE